MTGFAFMCTGSPDELNGVCTGDLGGYGIILGLIMFFILVGVPLLALIIAVKGIRKSLGVRSKNIQGTQYLPDEPRVKYPFQLLMYATLLSLVLVYILSILMLFVRSVLS